MSDFISGYFLEMHGWEKNGANYIRGNDTVFFDGEKWKFNGAVIDGTISANPELKKPQFHIPDFKDNSDYYERLMENK